MSEDYASNTPVSRPTILPVEETRDFGGVSWNSKIGFFYPSPTDLPPFRKPFDRGDSQ